MSASWRQAPFRYCFLFSSYLLLDQQRAPNQSPEHGKEPNRIVSNIKLQQENEHLSVNILTDETARYLYIERSKEIFSVPGLFSLLTTT